jgi:redox-sensitive bicupin YhaK (pirin superfamily)
MEIITYVLEGAIQHRDSTGERHILRPNEVQAMSAGSGIVHSEFNASDTEPSRSIQIWITTLAESLRPAYQQITFGPAEKRGRLRLLAGPRPSPDEPAAIINQDASVYAAELHSGESVKHAPGPGRYGWVQVVRGGITLNGRSLKDGDGAAISSERELSLTSDSAAGGEFLFFDLP